jgi:protein pelota
MLKQEPGRAFYGPKHVMRACEAEAIETLLISDKLFRANNVAERRKGRLFFCCKLELF